VGQGKELGATRVMMRAADLRASEKYFPTLFGVVGAICGASGLKQQKPALACSEAGPGL